MHRNITSAPVSHSFTHIHTHTHTHIYIYTHKNRHTRKYVAKSLCYDVYTNWPAAVASRWWSGHTLWCPGQLCCAQSNWRRGHIYVTRDQFVYAPSQREATLQCNVVSHWLGACTSGSLCHHTILQLDVIIITYGSCVGVTLRARCLNILVTFVSWCDNASQNWVQGTVSIRKTVLPGMAIPMLKIRRPNGRLIFNMEITIRR